MPKVKRHYSISLSDYIKTKCGGSNAEMGRRLGITRQSVGELVKRGAMVANGKVYTSTREIIN